MNTKKNIKGIQCFFFLFLSGILFTLNGTLGFSQSKCETVGTDLTRCLEAHYTHMRVDFLRPENWALEGRIQKEDLETSPQYFAKWLLFRLGKPIRKVSEQKIGFVVEYYENQRKRSSFHFVYRTNPSSTKLESQLVRGINYSKKGNMLGLWESLSLSRRSNRIEEFVEYNDFGLVVLRERRVYDSDSRRLVEKQVETPLLLEREVLGALEYE